MSVNVGILMGSRTDWQVMEHASNTLTTLEIEHEVRILSAHRSPEAVFDYAKTAEKRGLKVVIAAAGFAAHLAGVVAANTALPVLGVPLDASPLHGFDALLSTVQMPGGIPVATFAIGKAGAINAAVFAAQILAGCDDSVRARLHKFRQEQSDRVLAEGDPRRLGS
jgi:5-(carboxyamino)imidazole ribonucleotide mutase